jgi:FKBP-type peptidyl-prolyl cis-trans isomerase
MRNFHSRPSRRNGSNSTKHLEPLEIRTLLSAALALTGNSVSISSGDDSPSILDFTDFGYMSTTATTAIGTISRTFQITNNGDSDLNLTGSSSRVTISGANAGDFLLSSDASSSVIAAGASVSFTINFVPQATGLRQATLTIDSDDPTQPEFSFIIQGTGLATSDSANGLQVATIASGTGSAAINGSNITVNYTGYLTTGEIFDSTDTSINADRTPFELVLGRNTVIIGWEEGLLGVQAGETRVLIIPSDLAYGSSSYGSVPADAPLIFVVSADTVVQPTISVSANSTNISNGDAEPSTADFTDFGYMSTTNTLGTVTRTFTINNTTSADLYLTGSPLVSLSGANAADFTVTLTPDSTINSGSASTFTISFVPQASGLRQATVTIASTDLDVPNFTFDIQGTGLLTTDNTDGLSYVTTTIGSGLAAETGSHVVISYSGTFFDGTAFSTASSSILAVTLGNPNLSDGLTEGLSGIQPGETRTLFVTSSMRFGTGTTDSDYASLPLIYVVTAQSVNAASPIITITGNDTTLSNGDTTPSDTDFTDFDYAATSVNSSVGYVTRTFTIANDGSEDLVLGGGISAIKITGANKNDFTLVSYPTTYVASFGQTSFTIAFTPHGTGLRHATVTLVTNDPDAPIFIFEIQGTGVSASTNTNTGLQIAKTARGTGTAGIDGASLTVSYTGYLLDGTIFDSSDSFQFNVGQGNVITGWDDALLNAKVGESVILFIPASLAYGDSGSGTIPANAPLIFKITVLAVENPSIVVTGNDVSIAYKDRTPSSLDDTAISTEVGSSDSVSVTYTISSSTDGLTTYPESTSVVLSTNYTSNFYVSTITNYGTYATFSVTFTPTVVGTRKAVVHIYTADPKHPDFSFTVSGTYTSFVDLSADSIGTIKYPIAGTAVTGSTTKYCVPVTVTNNGNISVSGSSTPVAFDFYLYNVADETQTLFASQTTRSLRGLGTGRSKTLKFNVTVPDSLSTGNYQMMVLLNSNAAIDDTNSSNNTATSTQTVLFTQGYHNLLTSVDSSTLPMSITAGQALAGSVNVVVGNAGNLTLPAGQKLTLTIIARSDSDSDVTLKTSVISVSRLAPGKALRFTVSGLSATALSTGSYQLLAEVTPVQTLTETSTDDNLALLTSDGGSLTLAVA